MKASSRELLVAGNCWNVVHESYWKTFAWMKMLKMLAFVSCGATKCDGLLDETILFSVCGGRALFLAVF